jgi:hypothetical protein
VCIREIVRTITRAPERATLVRLVISEAPHFPVILDMWHSRGIVPLIAEPLAKMAAAGMLDTEDPAQAAEHLNALTIGQVSSKSMMGTIQLSESETDRIITSGIAVFLRAYLPTPGHPPPRRPPPRSPRQPPLTSSVRWGCPLARPPRMASLFRSAPLPRMVFASRRAFRLFRPPGDHPPVAP